MREIAVILKSSLSSLLICFFLSLNASRGYKFYGKSSTFTESTSVFITFVCLTLFFYLWWRTQSVQPKRIFKHSCFLFVLAFFCFFLSLFASKTYFSYKEPFIVGTFSFYVVSVILLGVGSSLFAIYRIVNEENDKQISRNKMKRFF